LKSNDVRVRAQIPHGIGFFTVKFKLRFDGLWEHGFPKLGHLYGILSCTAIPVALVTF
jgi:hypothetical protein